MTSAAVFQTSFGRLCHVVICSSPSISLVVLATTLGCRLRTLGLIVPFTDSSECCLLMLRSRSSNVNLFLADVKSSKIIFREKIRQRERKKPIHTFPPNFSSFASRRRESLNLYPSPAMRRRVARLFWFLIWHRCSDFHWWMTAAWCDCCCWRARDWEVTQNGVFRRCAWAGGGHVRCHYIVV